MKPFIQAYGHYDSSTGTYILSSKIQSLTTSIINVGELVGAVSSYIIGDHLGRRGGLFVSSFMVVLGVVFQTASHYLGMLIVGRLVLGKHELNPSSNITKTTYRLTGSFRICCRLDLLLGPPICSRLCTCSVSWSTCVHVPIQCWDRPSVGCDCGQCNQGP